jgi:hypothetical protein
MHEMLEDSARHPIADVATSQIQMVVLEKGDPCATGVAQFLDDSVGKGAVDGDVTLLPGLFQPVPEVTPAQAIQHAMMEEPQSRIAQDVVVEVVSALVRDYEPHATAGSPALLRLRPAAGRYPPVGFGHGRRHPGDVGRADRRREGGRQAAAANARRRSLTVLPVVFQGTPVAGDYQAPTTEQGGTLAT